MRSMRVIALFAAAAAGCSGGCYKLPVWSGDEPQITPVESEARERCGAGELTEVGGGQLLRAPYLQSVGPRSASIVFAAFPGGLRVEVKTPEDEPVASAAARYAGEGSAEARRRAVRRRGGEPVSPDDFYLVKGDVENLEPNTLYCYQVFGAGGALTEPAPLITAPAPGDDAPVRFVALGDSGNGSAAQTAIAHRLGEARFDFLLFLGDLAYTDGTAEELQAHFFSVYGDYLRYAPAFPAMGNHDFRTRRGAAYLEAFVLPNRETERYYSFDWGNVHMVAIDTTDFDAEHREWLERDLERHRGRWVIVYGHHPIYSNGFRGPRRQLRQRLEPILARHDVDIYLAGHEHHYERFGPRLGVNHVVSGGAGGRLTRLYARHLTVRQATVHHYLTFEIEGDTLEMRAVDIEGDVFDEMTLREPVGEEEEVAGDGAPRGSR